MTSVPIPRSRRTVVVGVVLSLLIGTLASPVNATETTPGSPLASSAETPRYLVELEPGAIPVTVKLDHPNIDQISRDAVAEFVSAEVEASGGEVVHDYGDLPYLVVEEAGPSHLSNLPGVVRVIEEPTVRRTISDSLDQIDATDVDMSGAIGGARADGSGWAVAVIDDGIDRSHPFFVKNGQSRVVAEACFTSNSCSVGTGNASAREGVGSAAHLSGDYHGTHVAGVAAGKDSTGISGRRGVASDSSILAVRVFNPNGSAYLSDIDSALEWVRVKAGSVSVSAVNLSLGGSYYFPGTCDNAYATTKARVDQLRALGVAVVVAAGNEYQTELLPYPACLSNVIVVGAVDGSDEIADFSNISQQVVNRGVLAPGVGIVSSVPTSINGTGFASLDGTSMAAPFVAGAISLLRQAKPGATLVEIQEAVVTSATTVDDTRNFTISYTDPDTSQLVIEDVIGSVDGMTRLDVWRAIGSVLPGQGEVSGRIKRITFDTVDDLANTPVTVSAVSAGGGVTGSAYTGPSGAYRLRLPPGSFSLSYSGVGLTSLSTTGTVVASGQTSSVDSWMFAPGTVSGTVSIDQTATPTSFDEQDVLEVSLTASRFQGLGFAPQWTFPRVDLGGAFVIDNAPPGNWSVTAAVVGFSSPASTRVDVTSSATTSLNLQFEARVTALAMSPSSGSTLGGTRITLEGRHLDRVTSVSFGGTAGRIESTAPNGRSMEISAPARGAGSVGIVLGGTWPIASNTLTFSYIAPFTGGGGGGDGGGDSGGGSSGGGGGAPSPVSQSVSPGSGGSTVVQLGLSFGAVRLSFSGLQGPGSVTVTPKAGLPSANSGGIVLPGYWLDITSSLGSFGSVEVCAPIETSNLAPLGLSVGQLRLFHWENNVRRDVTTRIDTANNRVCGAVSSFSPFAVGALKTTRVAGENRYETAAKLSASSFSPGVVVAYVVTGEKFPDALAAGAAAGREGGPVLLTQLNSLPGVTVNELKRVAPKRVVVVGGTAVISDAVIASIRTALPGVPVERIAGGDRFETAAKLSQRTFTATNGTVYLGSGLGFTEILAGAALAGRDKAPLLLVPGTGPNAGVPASVAAELKRLNPRSVVVLGGSSLVVGGVVDSLKSVVPNAGVSRIDGIDGYDTAARIARSFPSGSAIYVATGAVFADGLAGGAVAATLGVPMVMVPASGSLSSAIRSTLGQLRPSRAVVLGGMAAIGRDVENAVAGYLP